MIKVAKIGVGLLIMLLAFITIANYSIEFNAKNKTYVDVDAIPKNKVGLLLGTSKTLANGTPNWYYVNRVNAAVLLLIY